MEFKTDEKIINYIRKKISAAERIVAVIGIDMLEESGGVDYTSNEETYRIEEKYGYSPEDMLSTSFFNAKVERFYNFYKNEFLNMKLKRNAGYDALLKLQKRGKLQAVISQNLHDLPDGVVFKKLIRLNGTVKQNKCPRCGKQYSLRHIKRTEAIPLCDDCKVVIRPEIRLVGERMDATTLSEATSECEKADVLLILGRAYFDENIEHGIDNNNNQLRVYFTHNPYAAKREVDFVIYDEIKEILPLLIQ